MTPSEIHVLSGEVRIVQGGQAVAARLRLDGSTLVLDMGRQLGAVPILLPPADGTWALQSLDVSPEGARLTAVIRTGILLPPL